MSKCGKYRYKLVREWNERLSGVTFICLNPSIADENIDDPTILKCVNFAKKWGCGSLTVLNLFALRSTDPKVLCRSSDPVGEENYAYLNQLNDSTEIKVAAWGNHGNLNNRGCEVSALIKDLYYLRLNKTAQPAHPLYLPAELNPVLWVSCPVSV